MGFYKYIREIHKTPQKNLEGLHKQRLMQFRREPTTVRVDYPTRLDRARSLGYRAKQGIIVVRQRVDRGGRMHVHYMGARRSKAMSRRKDLDKSYQSVAEERVQKKYPNCEVLNSYYIIRDGMHFWYEVILVDKDHPSIRTDSKLSWISSHKHTGRVFRGLTSSGKKSRGLRNKGKGAEKVRPSMPANKGRLH